MNWEMFYTLKEAQIIVEPWRNRYNTIKRARRLGLPPASPVGYRSDRAKAWPCTNSSWAKSPEQVNATVWQRL